jgi:hypothetical protein
MSVSLCAYLRLLDAVSTSLTEICLGWSRKWNIFLICAKFRHETFAKFRKNIFSEIPSVNDGLTLKKTLTVVLSTDMVQETCEKAIMNV